MTLCRDGTDTKHTSVRTNYQRVDRLSCRVVPTHPLSPNIMKPTHNIGHGDGGAGMYIHRAFALSLFGGHDVLL